MEHEDSGKYRQLLVRTLHQCSVKFADVASTVIPVVCPTSFSLSASLLGLSPQGWTSSAPHWNWNWSCAATCSQQSLLFRRL